MESPRPGVARWANGQVIGEDEDNQRGDQLQSVVSGAWHEERPEIRAKKELMPKPYSNDLAWANPACSRK